MEKLAPIVIFVYSRPKHTRNIIESLSNNSLARESEVYIFSDSAKKEKDIENVKKVREYINTIPQKKYFKKITIIEAKKNKGLAKSVIEGVTDIINIYDKAIVIEDDLVVSNNFLEYMNNALNFYEKDNKIWSISGYNLPLEIPRDYKHDVYLGYRGCSWGWATWKDRWNTVDWLVEDYDSFKNSYKRRKRFNRGGPDLSQMLDHQMKGLIDSWAIRWCYEQSKQNKYTIYPVKSFIENNGMDGTGTHSGTTNNFNVEKVEYKPKLEATLEINKKISRKFYKKYSYGIKQKIKEWIMIFKLEGVIDIFKARGN